MKCINCEGVVQRIELQLHKKVYTNDTKECLDDAQNTNAIFGICKDCKLAHAYDHDEDLIVEEELSMVLSLNVVDVIISSSSIGV